MTKVHYWGNREVAYRPIFLNQPPELNTPEVRSMSGLTAINMTLNYQTKTPWIFFVKGDLNLGSALTVLAQLPTLSLACCRWVLLQF